MCVFVSMRFFFLTLNNTVIVSAFFLYQDYFYNSIRFVRLNIGIYSLISTDNKLSNVFLAVPGMVNWFQAGD